MVKFKLASTVYFFPMRQVLAREIQILIKSIALTGVVALAFGNAQATLFDRGTGLIYDTDRNITWYDHTYTGPTGSGASWFEAMTWASGLTVGGTSGWRLPSALSPDGNAYIGMSETGSEMGHLFVNELGNANHYPINEIPTAGPFTQLAIFQTYWTNTTYLLNYAYYFDFSWFGGNQNADFKDFTNAQQVFPSLTSPPWHNGEFAMAVHEGDVASPAPVPEPATYTMLLAGLCLLSFSARRRKQLAAA